MREHQMHRALRYVSRRKQSSCQVESIQVADQRREQFLALHHQVSECEHRTPLHSGEEYLLAISKLDLQLAYQYLKLGCCDLL